MSCDKLVCQVLFQNFVVQQNFSQAAPQNRFVFRRNRIRGTRVALLSTLIVLFSGKKALACPQCWTLVKSSVYNLDFTANFLLLIFPLFVLLIIGIGLHFWDKIVAKFRKSKGR